jgi:hypothetical protein
MTPGRINLAIFGMLLMGASLASTPLVAQTTTLSRDVISTRDEWESTFDPGKFEGQRPFVDRASELEMSATDVRHDQSAPGNSLDSQSQQTAQRRTDQESALDRVTDPTSSTITIRFRESWNWPVGDSGLDSQEFQFRPTIPFKAWNHENILRVTVPYDVEGADAPGLDDVTVLDLVVHKAAWGRWGVGPVVRFSPANGTDSATFQIGPAAGAVSKDEHWTVGFLAQNFFGDNLAESRSQPILTYKFDEQWAIGVGEFEFRYDWIDGTWTQLPLGIEVDYIAEI